MVKNQKDGIDKVDLLKTSAHPSFADTRSLGSGRRPKRRSLLAPSRRCSGARQGLSR
jgi:hypothetical protein